MKKVDNGAPADPTPGLGPGVTAVSEAPAGRAGEPATQNVLEGKPEADPGLTWLYPYDKTVWPQGLLPPLLQWKPRPWATTTPSTSTCRRQAFDYQGFFSAPVAGSLHQRPPPADRVGHALYSNQGGPGHRDPRLRGGRQGVRSAHRDLDHRAGDADGHRLLQLVRDGARDQLPRLQRFPSFGGATLAIKHGATSPVLVAGTHGGYDDPSCRCLPLGRRGRSTLVTQHGDDYNETSAYALTKGNAESVMPPPWARRSPSRPLPRRHVPLQEHGATARDQPPGHERPLLHPVGHGHRGDRPAVGPRRGDPRVLTGRHARGVQLLQRATSSLAALDFDPGTGPSRTCGPFTRPSPGASSSRRFSRRTTR